MSEAYWKLWNPEVQAKIDKDIEKYRKTDAILKFEGIPSGTELKVRQLSHDFLYSGNIFLFGDLKTTEKSKRNCKI